MYQIKYTASFKRDLKELSKKYPQIKKDLSSLLDQLEEGIFEGDELQDFPGTVYKVRVGSTDQRRGKRGGFRVIYLIVSNMETVHLMAIYAKARQTDLTHRQKQELKEIIEFIIDSEEQTIPPSFFGHFFLTLSGHFLRQILIKSAFFECSENNG